MLIIAITGKIGSGKSLIGKYLEKKGAYYINMDYISKKVRQDVQILKKIRKYIGSSVFTNNVLDTKKLKNLIFNDIKQRLKLNAIMWPLLKKELINEIKAHKNFNIIVVEAAVLLQAGWNKYVDKIIYIHSDWEKRVRRVINRDNLSITEIKNISQQQDNYETFQNLINYRVINNKTKEYLYKQIINIFNKEKWSF